MSSSEFNPNTVSIPLTFNFQQINLILEGLGKLPLEKVESLYVGIRTASFNTMNNAEQAHRAAFAKLDTAKQNADAEDAAAAPAQLTSQEN